MISQPKKTLENIKEEMGIVWYDIVKNQAVSDYNILSRKREIDLNREEYVEREIQKVYWNHRYSKEARNPPSNNVGTEGYR